MYVETYQEKELAYGFNRPVPFPEMALDEVKIWRKYFPVTVLTSDTRRLIRVGVCNHVIRPVYAWRQGHLYIPTKDIYRIPAEASDLIAKALSSGIFDDVQIWSKGVSYKDPIAVGIMGPREGIGSEGSIGENKKYFKIARWGSGSMYQLDTIRRILYWRNMLPVVGSILGFTVATVWVVLRMF